jgi:hypothetical protein
MVQADPDDMRTGQPSTHSDIQQDATLVAALLHYILGQPLQSNDQDLRSAVDYHQSEDFDEPKVLICRCR